MKSQLGELSLQSFILKLSTTKLEKVDETFVGLCADSEIDKMTDDQIRQQNEWLMSRFSFALLGKDEHDKTPTFEKLTVENATLWMKQVRVNDKSIRLVFFPYVKYDLEIENGSISYKKMVSLFLLFNKLLKPEITLKKTLISFSYMRPPGSVAKGKPRAMKLSDHMEKTRQKLKNHFNLNAQQIKSKIVYVIDTIAKRQDIVFNEKIHKESKVYVLTIDQTPQPLYALDPVEETITLKNDSTNLLKKINYVDTAECHLHFNYNQFLGFKPKCKKDLELANNISDEIWAVIVAVIHPVYKVKQQIYKKYKLETESIQKPNAGEMPLEYPRQSNWKSEFAINKDFKTFNEIFGYKQWKKQMNEPRDDLEDIQFTKSEEKRLVEFTELIDLNIEFINQEEKFNHALIMNQLNKLSEKLKNQSHKLEIECDLVKRYLIERKIFEFTKIIVRFLDSLKNHRLFIDILTDYEAKFYEHLLTIYSEAYDEFCWATKTVYGKLFDLSQKISNLTSSKNEILKVLKNYSKQEKVERKNCSSIEEVKRKKKMLRILLDLFEHSRPNEINKEIEKKILLVKWDLALTHKTLGISGDFGNAESSELKDSLKIFFLDLYKYLFLDSKNFATDYPEGVGFTELELLRETSGILKALGRLDLSIEIEKKQGNHSTIQNYYNRLLMKYRRDMGDVDKIREILLQAIKYFKTKHLPEKVQYYFNLLIQTGTTLEEGKKFDMERLDYENDLNDPVNKKKLINAAKKVEFPLTKTTIDEILKLLPKDKPKSLILME